MSAVLRIGTRGSRSRWRRRNGCGSGSSSAHPGLRAELVVIKTSGDRIRDVPLYAARRQGAVRQGAREALLDGSIDCAVHSLKDLPGELAPGLVDRGGAASARTRATSW